MLRILHTSDWHLGHTLHGVSRALEHARFLSWLLDLLDAEQVDALLIAGDVFDSACPPAAAERAFFDFLAAARRRRPALDVVVIAGNHDSPARLDAPARLLEALGVHTVGWLPRGPDGALDPARLLAPLRDPSGAVAAWAVAIPFLRPADLPPVGRGEDARVLAGVRAVHADAVAAARARRAPGQALVALGHGAVGGALAAAGSERRVVIGDQHAVPDTVFPDDLAYVALGHIHRAQQVGERAGVRYCGSPLPLSLAEADYEHQVLRVDLEGEALAGVRAVRVPRAVDVLRLPVGGPAPLAAALAAIEGLPARTGAEAEAELPLLELRVALDGSDPSLRARVEEAVAGRAVRLVKLTVAAPEARGPALADSPAGAALSEVDPIEVFARCHEQRFGRPPGEALRTAFAELLVDESVQRALAGPVAEPLRSPAAASTRGGRAHRPDARLPAGSP